MNDTQNTEFEYHERSVGRLDDLGLMMQQQISAEKFVDHYMSDLNYLGVDLTGKKVLSVGCGVGLHELAMIRRAVNVYGIDYSQALVDVASRYGPVISLGDIYALDFPDSSFDYVICNLVLHHLDDIHSALAEAKRVLKPDGRVIIYEHNYRNPLCWVSARLIAWSIKMPRAFWLARHNREHFLGNRAILQGLAEAGFTNLIERPFHYQDSVRGVTNKLYWLYHYLFQYWNPNGASQGILISGAARP